MHSQSDRFPPLTDTFNGKNECTGRNTPILMVSTGSNERGRTGYPGHRHGPKLAPKCTSVLILTTRILNLMKFVVIF